MLHTTLCPRVAAHNDQTTLEEGRMSAAMLGALLSFVASWCVVPG